MTGAGQDGTERSVPERLRALPERLRALVRSAGALVRKLYPWSDGQWRERAGHVVPYMYAADHDIVAGSQALHVVQIERLTMRDGRRFAHVLITSPGLSTCGAPFVDVYWIPYQPLRSAETWRAYLTDVLAGRVRAHPGILLYARSLDALLDA